MNDDSARRIIQIADRVTADLNDMVSVGLQSGLGDEEYRRFRRIVGRIMGDVYLEILRPLYDSFPHLEPEDLKSPLGERGA